MGHSHAYNDPSHAPGRGEGDTDCHGLHDHHGHHHAPKDFGNAFVIGIALNSVFVVVEAVFGFLYGSMALVADAGHNLSDVLALLLAWGANLAAKRPPSERFTYGFKSSTILAALANAALLAVAIGAILFETLHRLFEPQEPAGMVMMVVAGIGVLINAGTAMLFMRGQEDLNIRGAYLHMAADALVSVGVVVAGAAILFTGIWWIDPLVSLAIVAMIAWSTWGLAKDSIKMGLLAVPARIDVGEVRGHLAGLEGVKTVHDLHIWPMSTTETALTAHLVVPGAPCTDQFLHDIAHSLEDRFGINHATIQIERGDDCEKGC
ncbi:cation diffusion facilitator family transporter [Erythrobacter sp. THAF29]|uniref:cation diffusion facilitator family transporter n=1 Tax=Erythrobacter sp. THAF29 TaxID=2587851 RepID=UPI0012683388|nr:cation diffusion facilitator family transporter [Erythrobacter sp. THAF29]QFT76956.1 Cadmium, cobalt and zinc/H(+)-K(+) antiporter [Erythrobacter sp. THAF29]